MPAAAPAPTPSPTVVRLFPDYAGTVLWLEAAVPYDATGLDADLITALIRWEIEYYDALDDSFTWRSPAHAARFTAAGVTLALRLAMQLGSGFDIEFASYEAGVATRRFRSDLPADNPAAAAAFTALAGQPRCAPVPPPSTARPRRGSASR